MTAPVRHALLIPAGAEALRDVVVRRDFPVDLLELQRAVGGYIEPVHITHDDVRTLERKLDVDLGSPVLLVDEEARLKQERPLPNPLASVLAGVPIFGPALVIDIRDPDEGAP